MLVNFARFGAAAAAVVAGSTLAFAQILAGPLSNQPDKGLWYVDIATGDRVRVCNQGSSAVAVDDAGGRVFLAQSSQLLQWNYGSALNGATTLGTMTRAGGGALECIGLAYGGGRLFATAGDASLVYEISLASLVATPVLALGSSQVAEGLSFDASTGLFYVAQEVVGPMGFAANLYSLDLLGTGVGQFVAQIPGDGDSVCVGNGVAYLMSETGGRITTYDLATGALNPNALIAPWAYGVFECGSEFAPSFVPPAAPRIYCQATPAQYCAPVLTTTGTPSASSATGFTLRHQRLLPNSVVRGNYSLTGRSPAPFQTGVRCLSGPVTRLLPALGTASTPYCGNVLLLDFNAVIASGTNPALVAGQTVWYQATVLPPASAQPNTLQFTAGVEFTIQP
ncbi:MAG: hypothetical protein NTV21_09840 [Planctomycetota bacterium]|nr:hypothetical protein [Planctomycetota bacterium]